MIISNPPARTRKRPAPVLRQKGLGIWPFDEFELDYSAYTGGTAPIDTATDNFPTDSPATFYSTSLPYDFSGTQPVAPSSTPVNQSDSWLQQFASGGLNFLNTAASTYSAVRSPLAGPVPVGSQLLPKPPVTVQQPFLSTPAGKLLLPVGIAALIFALAR